MHLFLCIKTLCTIMQCHPRLLILNFTPVSWLGDIGVGGGGGGDTLVFHL